MFEINKYYLFHRRNHERIVSVSGTAGVKQERERVELYSNIVLLLFCIAVGNACDHIIKSSKGKVLSDADAVEDKQG